MRTGVDLLRRSLLGLLDTALPETSRSRIVTVLESFRVEGVQFHALRTRQAGRRRFVSVHILVPGHWSVQSGHDLLERVEEQIRVVIPGSIVFTHLEPLEDPMSFADVQLDRAADDPSSQRRIH